MSTTIKTGWLKDSDGNKFAPKTMSSQVIKNDGTLLEDNLNLQLNELKQYTDKELAKKANSEHSHDEYCTEVDIDTKLESKANTTHNHNDAYDTKGSAFAVQTNLNTVSDTLDSHKKDSNIHVTETEKATWNSKSNFSGNYNDLTNKPTISASAIGLGNVNNTSDENKPVSTAQQAAIDTALANAKSYTNTKTEGMATTTVVGTKISNHNSSTNSHNDIRTTLASVKEDVDAFFKDATISTEAKDTLKEIQEYITSDVAAASAMTASINNKAEKSDLTAHTGSTSIHITDAERTEWNAKANSSHGTHVSWSTTSPKMNGTASVGSETKVARGDHIHPTDTSRASKTEFDSHVSDTTKHITSTERTDLGAAYTHSQSDHAPSDAQKNQNAFSNIKVGNTTIVADNVTDTLELVGSNVTITPDATNDKVTIAVADGSTSTKGIVQLTNSTSSTSTTTAATPNSVKSAYDLANTAKTNAATAQTKADSAYSLADSKVDSLSDLGITATATELNYVDGVTSNIQTQLDGKSNSDHTHNYAGSSSAGGAANSANKVNKSLTVKLNGGTTEGTNSFTFDGSTAKSVNITPSSIGAAASSHTHDDRYYTETEVDNKLSSKANTSDLTSHTGNKSNPHGVTASQVGAIPSSQKGTASGVAELDANGKVPSSQLPSFVDDVLEYNAKSSFPSTGDTGKIYVDTSTNLTYRWSGSTYVEISPSLALGETSSTAYRGDRGKVAYDHSQTNHARTDATKVEASSTNGNIKINGTETNVYTHPSGTNPHGTTKSDVGLSNVPNVATNDQTPTFSQASSRTNIASGEKLSVILGKIMKWFADLKTVAFTGSYNDLSNKPTIPSAYTHPSYTARTGVPTANQTPGFGGTFTVTQPVSDATGHITAMNSRTITIPSAVATTSANGLMSSSDKTKLNNAAQVVEVTQAQYDALGDAVNTNGITYFIKDAVSSAGGMEFKQVTTLPSDASSKANTIYIIA